MTPEEFKADIKLKQSQGRKVMISLGGGGQIFGLESDADTQRFVTSVESICAEFGFDGIDIDFETPSLELQPGDVDPKHPMTRSTVNLIAAIREIHDHFGPQFMVLFTATVLLLYWRLALKQSDESLRALSATAANVVASELAEHATLAAAAQEMESVVRQRDYVVAVLDPSGTPIRAMPAALPMPAPATLGRDRAFTAVTTRGADGSRWRTAIRSGDWHGQAFTVVVATPMYEAIEQWRRLLEACAIGVPFVLVIAVAGGWLLGRRGLRPLAEMATEARAITATALDSRLTVPDAGSELLDVATSFNHVLDRLGTALATQRRFMSGVSAAQVRRRPPTSNPPPIRAAPRVLVFELLLTHWL